MKKSVLKPIKFLYQILPFKQSLLSVLRLFWIPSKWIRHELRFEGIVKVELDNGQSFQLTNKKYFIEGDFFWYGKANTWERESLKAWQKLCQNQSVVFDIGANTGIYGLIAKTISPKSQVFAFEPQPNIHQTLADNNALNKMDIHCERIALSDFDGQTEFFNYGNDAFSGNTTAGSLNKNHRPEQQHAIVVECQTLAHYIEQKGITHIDLMKVDVETHEVEVLQGMGKYLAAFKPMFLIEIIDDTVGDKLHEMFAPLKYKYYYIDDNKGVLPVDNLKQREFNNYIITQTAF